MEQFICRLRKRLGITIAFIICLACSAAAQSPLNKQVSFEVRNEKLEDVLGVLSNKGNFYFSYSSNIIRKDSVVSLKVVNKTIKQVLDVLLKGYEYKENGNYIIIKKSPARVTVVATQVVADKQYTITGYIINEETGEKVSDASIYEKHQLASALSDDGGFFKLKLKSKYRTAEITISKELYEDTTVSLASKQSQQLTIAITPIEMPVTISPEDYSLPDSVIVKVKTDSVVTEYTFVKQDSVKVEKTVLGKFFLTSKQKVQSLNLKKVIAERPFQVSLTPGLSSHGNLSPQIVNNFSLNIFGGYTGGTEGVEVGGLFNINKKDARYVQVAGVFNIVGGSVAGVQVAGIHNLVLQDQSGVQVAGISNIVRSDASGVQVCGIYNHATNSVKGVQVAGIGNFTNYTKGVQTAGIVNITHEDLKGMQIAGVFNYAKSLKGMQIGLINFADTSDGYSIGLINFVRRGYHKIGISTNELMQLNVAFKSGNRKLYSILLGGMSTNPNEKLYSFGYGMGTEIGIGRMFSINPELTTQYLYKGAWDEYNSLNKLTLNANFKIGKYFSIYAGPMLNIYYGNQNAASGEYKSVTPPSGYHQFDFKNDHLTGWIGWNAGIHIF